MDLIASRAISWPLRTIDRNWSCSSCWVLVLALAIVFASLLASSANFTKHRLACQAEVLDLFCGCSALVRQLVPLAFGAGLVLLAGFGALSAVTGLGAAGLGAAGFGAGLLGSVLLGAGLLRAAGLAG